MSKNKQNTMKRFIVFSLVLFLVIIVVGSAVFTLSMQNIVSERKSDEMLRMLEIQRIKLEDLVNVELAIVLKMADSPLIKKYFLDPDNKELEAYAIEEIEGYRRAFDSMLVFWVNDIDKIFYFTDAVPYVVDPDNPVDYWYNMTLYETQTYNFNINYNPELGMMNFWVNAPVFDDDGNPIGMLGSGIELMRYVDALYSDVESGTELYLFNMSGEITGAADVSIIETKKSLSEELAYIDFNILREARTLSAGETRTYDAPFGKIAIGSLPKLEWYVIAIAPIGISDFDVTMVALFVVMMVVIALILIIFNMFIARYLRSLNKTMDSLEMAMTEVQQANIAKSRFLATMSHEIRTPLNAIIGITLMLLQETGMASGHVSDLKRIYASANNLLGIINDILDLSKIETGRLDLNPIEYDTPSMLNDTVQINIVRIGEKPIEFKLDVDEKLPSRFFGDELRLKQILNNLLSNAIKYTEKGHIKLSVYHIYEGDDTWLRMSVEDTGQGLKPEDKEKLFSEYMRFNSEANRATEGIGLGLNITRTLVSMMDGTIEVDSEYGKGSIFTVTVRQGAIECPPIGAIVAEQLRSFTYADNRQYEPLSMLREQMPYGKVLIVDDVEANLYVAAGLMSPYKLKIETAGSGFKAIEKVESGSTYDIIFMDHMMPKMDGIEATQKLREMGYNGVIVALTANALSGNDNMFTENGFDGYIYKPINMRYLNDVLNRFVRDRHPEERAKYKLEEVVLDEGVSPAEPDDGLARLREISGLDVDIALAGMGRMRSVYVKTVWLMLRELPATLKKMDGYIERGDAAEFGIEVHGLKSVLQSIGAFALGRQAADLEEAAGEGRLSSGDYRSFKASLEELSLKLNAAAPAEVSNREPVDADTFAKALEEVKAAAADFDSLQALDILSKVAGAYTGSETGKLLEEAIRALETFDCERALVNINAIIYKEKPQCI